MSKVKKEIIEAAMMKFMANITATMPTTAHKFLFGSISALMAAGGRHKISQFVAGAADADGYIDVDDMKAAIYGGFDATGGKIQIDLFKDAGGIMPMFLKPLTLTIVKDDVTQLMREIEDNAIQDVRISNEKTANVSMPVQGA